MNDVPSETRGPCPSCSKPAEVRANRSRYCKTCYNDRYNPCVPCSCGRLKSRRAVRCRTCVDGSVPQPRLMSAEEIAWVAGIIEGEGSFVAGAHPCIKVQMTDSDIIDRLGEVTGIGRIYHDMKVARMHHKASSGWYVNRRDHVEYIVRLVYPWLGVRRKAAAERLVERFAERAVNRLAARTGLEPVPRG